MASVPLPPGSTVSLTLSGIPADLYLRLLVDAERAGRGLRAEVLYRLRAAPAPGTDAARSSVVFTRREAGRS